MFLKVIACEIAFREICHAAATSPNLLDLEFLTQGHHDKPGSGREEIQKRIDAVPAGKYDAIVLGYGLCSSILSGLTSTHTRLVVPRAHDCITLFLGSKTRYQKHFTERPGTYYFTSGWLECAARRGQNAPLLGGVTTPASANEARKATYEKWVQKYGEDQAKYLFEEMSRWTEVYSHGMLIQFDFLQTQKLAEKVRQICAERGWLYDETQGDLRLFQKLLDGDWPDADFLLVPPGQKIIPTFDEQIIGVAPPGGEPESVPPLPGGEGRGEGERHN